MTTYAQDSDGKYIPSSQRPDGTWRKARRVKDGYVPQEEVPLYESKGKQFMKKPTLPVGMCPIVAQESKTKRERQQIKQQQQQQQQQQQTANNIAGLIFLPNGNVDSSQKKKTPNNKNLNGPAPVAKKASAAVTKSKSKSTKTQPPQSVSVEEKTISDAISNINLSADEEIAKKLKKLRKKIREIEAIEMKMTGGDLKNPEQDQLDKIARKQQILDELMELEQCESQQ